MDQLPVEIIEKILMLDNLVVQDVINISLTSKYFQHLITDNNSIWRSKFYQKFPRLWNKLEEKPFSFYLELRHVYQLKKQTRLLLCEMAQKFYKKVELSNEDLKEWDNLMREKWDNYFYLVADLRDMINSKCEIFTMDLISLNVPGNLTQKYYAGKVLRFIRQIYVARMWKLFIAKPPERRLFEDGATLVAQWCQPDVNVELEDIHNNFDELANMVKNELKIVCPDHPLLRATKKQFDVWKLEVRPDNEWSPKDCRIVICAIKEVLFRQLGFMNYSARKAPLNAAVECDFFINIVLKTRKGMPDILSIIYESVARRLGLRCELIVFTSHFLLRFCESQHPDSDWYYIDVSSGGQIVKDGCPFGSFGPNRAGRSRSKRPVSTPEEVIGKIANDLEYLTRQTYSPSGRVTKLRSTLELIKVVNPKNVRALMALGTLYMQHNFSIAVLQNALLANDLGLPEVEGVAERFQEYRADPLEGPIEPVRRPPNCKKVRFAVGMVMAHKLFGYKCVIFNWDFKCMAAADWQWRNNISSLKYKEDQPFYNVLAEDNSHRYVAQENLLLIREPQGLLLDDEVGRYFSHYYETYYVPNAQSETHFPDDKVVRNNYHALLLNTPEEFLQMKTQ